MHRYLTTAAVIGAIALGAVIVVAAQVVALLTDRNMFAF